MRALDPKLLFSFSMITSTWPVLTSRGAISCLFVSNQVVNSSRRRHEEDMIFFRALAGHEGRDWKEFGLFKMMILLFTEGILVV
jgi:hypothetical protein